MDIFIDQLLNLFAGCRFASVKERSDIKVVKNNVDEEQELAMQFGVMSIPTLVVMKNGKIVNQVTGARPKAQILAML